MDKITVRPYGRKAFDITSFKPDRIVISSPVCVDMLGINKDAREPWIHIAVKIIPNGPVYSLYFVAYVWDTRKVVDEGFSHCTWRERPKLARLGKTANDNGKPLQGAKIQVEFAGNVK